MKNKKSVMTVSALFILIFHLWINLFSGSLALTQQAAILGRMEMFFKQTAYLGVDMFFFLSAYSLGRREVTDYKAFILSRFKAVYVKYIFFALLAAIYGDWAISRFFQVVFAVELIQKGGGSFLWFLPAIMLFYLFFPFFQKMDRKNRMVTALLTFGLWMAFGLWTTYTGSFKQLFIIWNRIPVFLVGYYFAVGNGMDRLWERAEEGNVLEHLWKILSLVLTILGYALLYRFGFQLKLQTPFTDMFYVLAIPASIGLILLCSLIPESKVMRWLGSSTLEIYAVQMIFGYKMENRIIAMTRNPLLINLLTLGFVLVLSVLIHYGYEEGRKRIFSNKK